jgi:asparagine N-glycosylation enzyme membrane subunit Stt3
LVSGKEAELRAELTKKRNEKDRATEHLQYLQGRLQLVDSKIASMLMIESRHFDYKKSVSIIFAGMVLLVISGFFAVTVIEKKAGEIFSNQSGLQFITLFSLVISIILFGVLGILEGRELAALLGAISGYVLGRVTAGETAETAAQRAASQTASQVQQQLQQRQGVG